MNLPNVKQLSTYIKSVHKKIDLGYGTIKLGKTIGQGGNGIVYSALLLAGSEAKEIAVKILTFDGGGSQSGKSLRFVSEYFNLQKLQDKNGIVANFNISTISFGESPNIFTTFAILMEKYEGNVANEKATCLSEFHDYLNFLLDTIEKIHNYGIIHRDLKPENILKMNKKYHIGDFGIASFSDEINIVSHETGQGERLGNRYFSAPEQDNSNEPASPQMDIYAIGQLLHYYVFGHHHSGATLSKISSLYTDLDPVYDKIIEKCLQNNANERFSNIDEIRNYISNNFSRSKEIRSFNHYYSYFNDLISKSKPTSLDRIVRLSQKQEIDKFMTNLSTSVDRFYKKLHWMSPSTSGRRFDNLHFNSSEDIFYFDNQWVFANFHINISDVYLVRGSRLMNDFMVLFCKNQEPIELKGDKVYEYAILNKCSYITYQEAVNMYVESENNPVEIKTSDRVQVSRLEIDQVFIIGTFCHNIYCYEAEKKIVPLFKSLIDSTIDNRESILINIHSSISSYNQRERIGYKDYQ